MEKCEAKAYLRAARTGEALIQREELLVRLLVDPISGLTALLVVLVAAADAEHESAAQDLELHRRPTRDDEAKIPAAEEHVGQPLG